MSDQSVHKAAEQTSNKDSARYDTPGQIAENFQKWWSAMEVSHAMLMAGLRDRVGEDGNVNQEYREWNRQRRARKMQAYEQAAARFRRRQVVSEKGTKETDAT